MGLHKGSRSKNKVEQLAKTLIIFSLVRIIRQQNSLVVSHIYSVWILKHQVSEVRKYFNQHGNAQVNKKEEKNIRRLGSRKLGISVLPTPTVPHGVITKQDLLIKITTYLALHSSIKDHDQPSAISYYATQY